MVRLLGAMEESHSRQNIMSCYFRHLKELFDAAGIEVTPANKKQADHAIHRLVNVDYKECPRTWKKLKQEILANQAKRQEFVDKLRAAMN